RVYSILFFFHAPPTPGLYTLSLHDALPILAREHPDALAGRTVAALPIRDALLGNMKPILASLLVAVALLLVIMGANLALLMLTRSEEHTSELQSLAYLVCRLLLEKKKKQHL